MSSKKLFKSFVAKTASAATILAMTFSSLTASLVIPAVPVALASTAVTSVTGVDNDTTGPGLDGRDFSVSWVLGTQPQGYSNTKIFILPSNITPLVNNITTTACGGNACQDKGFFFQFQMNQFTLPQFFTTDSAGNAWNAATQYKAWIFTDAESDSLDGSAAFSVTSDTVTDTNRPFIEHAPVHSATASANAIINAFVFDDQTTAQGFASGGANGVFQLLYGSNVAVTESTVNGVQVSGNLFQFTVPSASVPSAGGSLQYYLKAQDAASNAIFFCQNPGAATANDCKSAPFVVNTIAAGSRTVSGTVSQNVAGVTSALSGAYVFAGGYALAATSSAANGSYTIAGLPNNNAFDITASKVGFTKNKWFVTIGTSNVANVNLNLNSGEANYTGGQAGVGPAPMSGGTPHVVFSGPSQNVFGVVPTEKIRVGLDQSMNATTINDTNPTDASSNVYLTTDDGSTKIAGQVQYCANNASPGCSSLYSQDTNVVLFSPSSNLLSNTFYTLVITEGVTSQSGQSIEGNRPGGGFKLSFTTGIASALSSTQVTTNFGSTGQYMPPYVRSSMPAPGSSVAPNTKILLEFNTRLNTTTVTANTSVQLYRGATQVTIDSLTFDSAEQRFATITPNASQFTAGDYEIRVKGSVASTDGMTMMPPAQASSNAFVTNFTVAGSSDTSAPTIYAMVTTGSTGVLVNVGNFEFGFSKQMLLSTLTNTSVTLARGATTVPATVKYDPGKNKAYVIPNDVLAPNTAYTITFTTSVTDIMGNALASNASYTYTTGSADTTAPKVREARCDDNGCSVFFTEPMNQSTQVDANYNTSVLKPANITVDVTSDAAAAAALNTLSNVSLSYDSLENRLDIRGLSGSTLVLTGGSSFLITIGSTVTDLSSNAIGATNNSWNGKAESSKNTFGSFGDMGMFGPPQNIVGAAGFEGQSTQAFKPEGFGNFTASQFAFGQADMAFPFNQIAGQDSNVFQVKFNPGVALQDDDQVVLTFPSGTGITNAVPDTFSPFYDDMNEFGSGTVAFDSTFDSDGVSVDTTALKVTVKLAITGTPGANDKYTIDLRKVTNPAIPSNPATGGGYTVGVKVMRAGAAIVNKTTMPYFIMPGGSRSITINIYAGSQSSPASGATGDVFLRGGGPAGPMDRNVTLTNGIITAVDGTLASNVTYSNLNDGCYYVGTEPLVTLGGVDYFGQMSPEPLCVDSVNTSRTKNIVLTSSAGAGSMALTVKLSGISNFSGADLDIFAGGPNQFVVKNLTGLTTPDANGYTLRIPANGNWFVGVGPGMPKGSMSSKSATTMKQLPGVPPRPINLTVSGVGGTPAIATGFDVPPGVTVNTATKTVTFSFTAADKAITGQVTDGTTGLANVQVFMHSQGFGGSPAFTKTDASGNFTLNVSEYGPYEIGAYADGLPPVNQQIDVKPDGADAGTDIDIFFKGKQIVPVTNPLVLKINKASYTISGKVLDSSNNGIANAPVFANDADGNFVGGSTDSSGNYSVFVGAGTWTVRSELPPSKTDTCGTLTKTVTVTTASLANQNITPSTGTCVTVSGTVSVGGTALANVPLFVSEWDTANGRPVAGGVMRGTGTNSSGVYSVKLIGNKTYRIGTFDPDKGELSITQAVAASNISNADITVGTLSNITFAFTGGTSSMNAFVEVKKSADKNIRMGRQKNGLDSNLVLSVQSGGYDYFVNVFGVGNFSGTTTAGSTVTIDLSTSSLVTLSGNVKDADNANASNLKGVLVTAKDSAGLTTTAVTDSSGNYSLDVKSGTYTVSASLGGYTSGEAAKSVTLSSNTSNYDFGGGTPDQLAPVKAAQVITGTVYESDGTTAMKEGFVTATSSTGQVVSAPVDSQNGSYSLPVNAGTWTVKAKGPRHTETTRSSTVAITSADSASNNITLTADATRIPKAESTTISADVGGSLDSTAQSGIKVVAGSGVLDTGSTQVTVEAKKNYTAPDTENFQSLGDASFDITATGSTTIKDLKGTADIQINYTDLVSSLPAGVSEADLKLAYYSPERDEYVPVEGGFTVDAAANTITAQTNHFTTFAIVYAPPVSAAAAAAAAASTGGGGIPPTGIAKTSTAPKTIAQAETTPKTTVTKPISQMTKAELLSKIEEVKALIQTLVAQLAALRGEMHAVFTNVPKGFAFGKVIDVKGVKGVSDEVKYLQSILKKEVESAYGTDTPITGYFGPKTKAALVAFQEKYANEVLAPFGLAKGTGNLGTKTIQKLNALLQGK